MFLKIWIGFFKGEEVEIRVRLWFCRFSPSWWTQATQQLISSSSTERWKLWAFICMMSEVKNEQPNDMISQRIRNPRGACFQWWIRERGITITLSSVLWPVAGIFLFIRLALQPKIGSKSTPKNLQVPVLLLGFLIFFRLSNIGFRDFWRKIQPDRIIETSLWRNNFGIRLRLNCGFWFALRCWRLFAPFTPFRLSLQCE